MVYLGSINNMKFSDIIHGLHDCEKFRTFVYFLTTINSKYIN